MALNNRSRAVGNFFNSILPLGPQPSPIQVEPYTMKNEAIKSVNPTGEPIKREKKESFQSFMDRMFAPSAEQMPDKLDVESRALQNQSTKLDLDRKALDLESVKAMIKENKEKNKKQLDEYYQSMNKNTLLDYTSAIPKPKRGESALESGAGGVGAFFDNLLSGGQSKGQGAIENTLKGVGGFLAKNLTPLDEDTGQAGAFNVFLRSLLAQNNPAMAAVFDEDAKSQKSTWDKVIEKRNLLAAEQVKDSAKRTQDIEDKKLAVLLKDQENLESLDKEFIKAALDTAENDRKLTRDKILAQEQARLYALKQENKEVSKSELIKTFRAFYQQTLNVQEALDMMTSLGFSFSKADAQSEVKQIDETKKYQFKSLEDAKNAKMPSGTHFQHYQNGQLLTGRTK